MQFYGTPDIKVLDCQIIGNDVVYLAEIGQL